MESSPRSQSGHARAVRQRQPDVAGSLRGRGPAVASGGGRRLRKSPKLLQQERLAGAPRLHERTRHRGQRRPEGTGARLQQQGLPAGGRGGGSVAAPAIEYAKTGRLAQRLARLLGGGGDLLFQLVTVLRVRCLQPRPDSLLGRLALLLGLGERGSLGARAALARLGQGLQPLVEVGHIRVGHPARAAALFLLGFLAVGLGFLEGVAPAAETVSVFSFWPLHGSIVNDSFVDV